jgi:hypothetical protein
VTDKLIKDEHANRPADLNRRDAERAHDQIHEQANKVNEGTVNLGQIAIRNVVLANGGAAVTVLAFIGGLASQGRVSVGQLGDIAGNLTLFAVGVTLGALSRGLSYLTNLCHVGSLFSRSLIWTPPYVEDTAISKRWTRCSRILHSMYCHRRIGCISSVRSWHD